jgi:hypothetical protein
LIGVESPFPPGLVVIISSDTARFNAFAKSTMKLMVPHGSQWEWAEGTSIEANRNLALSKMKDHCRWVFTLDDDHSFEPDILMRLLQRMGQNKDVDILQAFCTTRKPPYSPWAYKESPNQSGDGIEYISATWDEVPTEGISEWDAVGTGGMLIRRKVIDAVKFPWFEVGKTFKDAYGEDLYFCYKARRLGFRIWIDSDNMTSHMTGAVGLRPMKDEDGRWAIAADMGHGVTLCIPQEVWAHAKFDEISMPKGA